MSRRILLVDFRPGLISTVRSEFGKKGYVVQHVVDIDRVLDIAASNPFDLLVLDARSPSGLTLCRHLRRAGLSLPIVVLPARQRTADLIEAMNAGADEYVSDPLNTRDLLTRVEVLLGRRHSEAPKRRMYEFGSIRVDVKAAEVVRNGKNVHLFAREFQLLQYFLEHPGIAFSQEELLSAVWERLQALPTRTVDVHVASLRRKLEDEPRQPRHFLTVHRLGYKFKP